jgi:hypothetical protein
MVREGMLGGVRDPALIELACIREETLMLKLLCLYN